MKIVQTFWTRGQQQHPLHNTGGWLSAEYHWLSWALSVLQLRQFYGEVELITDAVGKHILIDILQMPYTSVQVLLDEALTGYPQELWALAKIYTYSIQNEPFLHVDGDVYIWKRFEKDIEQALLVAQNYEVDFPFYHSPLNIIKNEFQNVPTCMLDELGENAALFSANAGVIGGNLFSFFREYKQLAFNAIDSNPKNLTKVEYKYLNICFEQFLYYCLAKEKNVSLSYVIDNNGQFDSAYPGFANFHKVPYKTWFIHCMAEYKQQEVVVRHLAKRLRQDFPIHYYHILRLCQASGLALHNKVYDAPALSLSQHDDAYFVGLDPSQLTPQSPPYFYAKDVVAYHATQDLFSLPFEQILFQKIAFSADAAITEETEPILAQTLQCVNLQTQAYEERPLDNLDMILYDACSVTKTIEQIIKEIGQYFPKAELEVDYRQFENLVLDRIRTGLYLGALERQK